MGMLGSFTLYGLLPNEVYLDLLLYTDYCSYRNTGIYYVIRTIGMLESIAIEVYLKKESCYFMYINFIVYSLLSLLEGRKINEILYV